MFRSMSSEGHLSSGQSSSSSNGHGVTSPGLGGQESSWIGLFSAVSRPLSLLQKLLPGRPRSPAVAGGPGWITGDLSGSFVNEEAEFLRQLDDMLPLTQHPAPHLTYLRCQQDGAGLLEPGGGGALPWITADSLREIGIQSEGDMDLNLCQQTHFGYLSSVRTFLSHVLLSSQEIKPSGGKEWAPEATSPSKSSRGRTWWGSLWGTEDSSQKGLLSDLSWAGEGTVTTQLCPRQAAAGTKAETTHGFVQSGNRASMLGENTGPSNHKEELPNNAGLHSVQNAEGSMPDHQLSISDHLRSSGAAAICSKAALLTPDQDNGYSSLEEEHFQMCHQYMLNTSSEEPLRREEETPENTVSVEMGMEGETSEKGQSTSGKGDEEEEQLMDTSKGQCAEEMVLITPQCQNKAIAFIMGCPCSDDDDSSSQSDLESSEEEEDDDGFDSEASSGLSDSSDEDDEDNEASDSDNEADSEAERLWNSLCQSRDPYNPQNFTARLHTGSTRPQSIPFSTPLSSTQSTPASSPNLSSLAASAPLTSSSPPCCHDVWDDSTSASEVDEAESLHLWSSFSCTSDPYSPFNFQASLRTRGPAEAPPRAKVRAKKASQNPLLSPPHNPASPPEYRKEEAEERLDSGFSEPCTSSRTTQTCSTTKKVRFCEDVEEFFASCGEEEEDRRGPWEELARDRCRFLRRCQEVEQSIAFCLQPQHRRLVYRRLTVLHVQDA